jgi:hypothetical protein
MGELFSAYEKLEKQQILKAPTLPEINLFPIEALPGSSG